MGSLEMKYLFMKFHVDRLMHLTDEIVQQIYKHKDKKMSVLVETEIFAYFENYFLTKH